MGIKGGGRSEEEALQRCAIGYQERGGGGCWYIEREDNRVFTLGKDFP
jgi:hypothetical protein